MEQILIPYHAVKRIDGNRVLVFAPHPDDEVFGCGGAIFCHVAAGNAVHVVVVTDGGFGADEENRAEYVLSRRNESREAAKLLGYGEPEFWAERDRGINYGEKLVRRVLEAIQNTDADLVYAPSVFEMHPDHRALGMVAVEAVRRLGKGVRLALYEVGMPLRPNLLLDISGLAQRKKAAMECFVSQNALQRYDLHIAALNRYRSYTLPANVTAVEAYILVTAEELAGDPLKLYRSERDRQRELGLILDSRDAPLVSVIIRSMDRPTLSEALDSVALQTYPNIEVVLVNAKGDGHREMSEWCGRFPLRLVGTGVALPRSRAANFGLESARGEYLIFLDDDDWFEPDHIENLARAVSANPKFRAAYSGVKAVDGLNNLLSVIACPYDQTRLWAANFIPIHACLFSVSLIKQGVGFDESLEIYEDWDFWVQISRHTDFFYIAGQSAVYRLLPDSDSGVHAGNEKNRSLALALTRRWYAQAGDKHWENLVSSIKQGINSGYRLDEKDALLAEKDRQLSEKDHQLSEKDRQLSEKDSRLSEKDHVLLEKDHQLQKRENEMNAQIQEARLERERQEGAFRYELLEAKKKDFKYAKSLWAKITSLLTANSSLGKRLEVAGGEILMLQSRLTHLESELSIKARHAGEVENKLNEMMHSRSWRITAPLRSVTQLARGGGERECEAVTAPADPAQTPLPQLPQSPAEPVAACQEYRDYLDCFRSCQDLTDEVRWAMRAQIDAMKYQPKISVRCSLLGLDGDSFPRLLDAVRYQLYPRWDLWFVDGELASEPCLEAARNAAKADARIHLRLEEDESLNEVYTGNAEIYGDWIYALEPDNPPPELAFYRLAFYLLKYNAYIASQTTSVATDDVYSRWQVLHDELHDVRVRSLRMAGANWPDRPLISVVMPVYNVPEKWLRRAIVSVLRQSYTHWEFCIADDCSSEPHVREVLEGFRSLDKRIKVAYRQTNGHISASSNSALELASGEFIALFDHDDELDRDALLWVANEIRLHPDAALIYSDEDKITPEGEYTGPYFKPDWNPDLLLSHNMISHLGVYRTDVVREIGGFRQGYEGSQDWDLALRVIEKIDQRQIRHIPRVLYHWRMIPNSTSMGVEAKPYAVQASIRAIGEYLERRGVTASAGEADGSWGVRVRYALPDIRPLLSIIIPTRNGLALIKKCVESLVAKTTYSPYEIIIVDNGSDDPETLDYLSALQQRKTARVIRDDSPFNYSALNNRAVAQAQGSVVALLNNDIEIINPDWAEEMVSHVLRPEIGAVGARLWYPDDTLQHAGIILAGDLIAFHAHKKLFRSSPGYFARAALIQNFSAVTAACLMVRKAVYQEVGGLDEAMTVAYNDVDFCLRVREKGYRILWTPYAQMYHHESASRGYEDSQEKLERLQVEAQLMKDRWGGLLYNDPAYNPNLTLDREDFSLAFPPRILK